MIKKFNFSITIDGENNVSIQCKVTSRWKDSSIRGLFINYSNFNYT